MFKHDRRDKEIILSDIGCEELFRLLDSKMFTYLFSF